MGVDEATTGLTTIVKGFGKDASDAMEIADVLTKVGQEFPISGSGLATALEKSASSLNAANNSFAESVALLTAGNAATQSPDSVGNFAKTISARIRGAELELKELGEYEEGVTLSSSKLRQELLKLSGVDIMVNDSTFKSTYQIIKELAGAWDGISDVDRARIIEDIAGKRGANIVQSMISNVDDLTGAYDAAMNAAGTATEANDIYMDSIEGRLGQLQSSFQVLSTDIFNSDTVKEAITLLTRLLDILDAIIDKVGLLPTIGAVGGGVKFFQSLD